MKQTFSEPKIYTGGEDISQWRSLPKPVQEEALNKEWYVYYSYRDPVYGYPMARICNPSTHNYFQICRSTTSTPT